MRPKGFCMSLLAVPTTFSANTSTASTGSARPTTSISARSERICGGRNWCCRSSLSITSPTTQVNSSRCSSAKRSSSFCRPSFIRRIVAALRTFAGEILPAARFSFRFSARLLNLFDKLPCRVGDRLEITRLSSAGKVATHSHRHRACPDPLADVLETATAGRHQRGLGQRPLCRFHEGGSQGLAGKELHDVGAALHGLHDFAHGSSARHIGNLVAIAEARGFRVQGRTHDVLCPGQNGGARGLRVEYRTSADQNLAGLVFPREIFNYGRRAGNRECNLDGRHAAASTSVSDACGLFGTVGAHDGDESGFNNPSKNLQFLHNCQVI